MPGCSSEFVVCCTNRKSVPLLLRIQRVNMIGGVIRGFWVLLPEKKRSRRVWSGVEDCVLCSWLML